MPESGACGDTRRGPGSLALPGIALCLLLAVPAVEAQRLNFQHYGVDDGLPQGQVFAIARDREGYLWAGTYSGVARYNGRTFQAYDTSDGLGSNVVETIGVDKKGVVWVGTGSGVCRLDRVADKFQCLSHPALASAHVYTLLHDAPDLWIGTDRGLFRVRGDEVIQVYDRSDGLPSTEIRSIAGSEREGIWVGTTRGLARFHEARNGFLIERLPGDESGEVLSLLSESSRLWIGTDSGVFLKSGESIAVPQRIPEVAKLANVTGIARSKDGALWLTTNEGVVVNSGDGFQHLTLAHGLRNEISYSVLADREGLLWIGHDVGLTKWLPSPFVGYMRNNGLLHPFVRTLNEDSQGRLWLGTRRGVQVVPYQKGRWRFENSWTITAQDGLLDERVYSIFFPRPGEALIATDKGVARWREGEGIVRIYTQQDGLQDNKTQALFEDEQGRIWIGTNTGTAILEDGHIRPVEYPGLVDAYVFRIRSDRSGRMWFASKNHGLFIRSDRELKRLDGDDGLTNHTLWDLAPDGNGGMWVGSNGGGLFHVAEDLSIERYTTQDGLADDFVWQVLTDARGDVWTFTRRGISRLSDGKFTHFNRSDGILNEEGGVAGGWESHDGQLWFASAEGLMRYDPEIYVPDPVAPPVVIERVALGGETLDEGTAVPYQAASLDFSFAALSFWAEEGIRFRYRLVGLTDQWSGSLAYRPITFGNLGAGSYVFEVQARRAGGNWSEQPARFMFSVNPPYWQAPWFWSLIAFTFAALFWGGIRFKTRRSEAQRRALQEVVRERTRELEVANNTLKETNKKLKDVSVKDPLTGLMNRRFLLEQIPRDIARAKRAYFEQRTFHNRDVVFMMIDLDHFKDINDTYGHFAGDTVLRGYAEIINRRLRSSDYVVRWGGEEFLIVACHAEAAQCNVIVERILHDARAARFEIEDGEETVRCTCSIGVSHFPFVPDDPDVLNWEQVVDIADYAVYMAKKLGRDGWVAIHGTNTARVFDGREFMHRLKHDFDSLVRNQEIEVEGDFKDPLGH